MYVCLGSDCCFLRGVVVVAALVVLVIGFFYDDLVVYLPLSLFSSSSLFFILMLSWASGVCSFVLLFLFSFFCLFVCPF